jgi:hypothetical protein
MVPPALVEYDNTGTAIDVPKMALLSKGVEEGNNYQKGKNPTVWKLISSAGDGTSKLQAYSALGELEGTPVTVPPAELAAEYKLNQSKLEFLENYPKSEGQHNKPFYIDMRVGQVKACLYTLATTMQDYELAIRTSPSRGVICKADTIDLLCLSPTTNSVISKDHTSKTSQYTCTVTSESAKVSVFNLHAPVMDKDFCSAFFAIQATCEEHSANVILVQKEVRFIVPSTNKLKVANHEFVSIIPCYENTKVIRKGDELLYFKVKQEKAKAVTPALKMVLRSEPVAKRQKR